MIQTSAASLPNATIAVEERGARVWGLSAAELHDAYWRASGVQCIRRAQTQTLQAGADLFLLLEADQLVLFDLRAMAERLAWRAASVTRVRVIGQDDEAHGEHVVTDVAATVERITRRYRPQTHAAYRVLLTRSRRMARAWMSGASRRSAWRRIRKIAGNSNIDAWRCHGRCLSLTDPISQGRLIDHLVQIWPVPNRAIDGITEIADGVWALPEQVLHDRAVMVGPAWLGAGCRAGDHVCLIGPTWMSDRELIQKRPVRIREIIEIEPTESNSVAAPVPSRRTGYAFAKRTLDVVVSGVGLLAISPIMFLIAICIWLEDGWPVLYRQWRQSRGGREFGCLKFRTMCRDADVIKAKLAEDNVCDGPQFYVQDDPRVTRVGRALRRSYLDELPQLWNVFIGDMSLVGPRPSPEKENQICPAWRELRLSVRPGLTGLWQLNRTRQPGTDFQEWIKFDVEYLERASFWFDLQLLARTALAMIRRLIRR